MVLLVEGMLSAANQARLRYLTASSAATWAFFKRVFLFL